MKKLMTIAALIITASMNLFAENLARNGNFEQLIAGKSAEWRIHQYCNETEIKFFADGSENGGYAQMIFPIDNKSAGRMMLSQDVTAAVKSKQKYQLSCKVRSKGFKGVAELVLCNDKWAASAGILMGKVPGKWTEFKKIVTMPEFKKQAKLNFNVKRVAKGTIEVTDIKLEKVEN